LSPRGPAEGGRRLASDREIRAISIAKTSDLYFVAAVRSSCSAAVRRSSCAAARRSSCAAARRSSFAAVRRSSFAAVRRSSCAAARRSRCAAVRRSSCVAARRSSCAAVRRSSFAAALCVHIRNADKHQYPASFGSPSLHCPRSRLAAQESSLDNLFFSEHVAGM
jgi:hypothetical protein